MTVSAWRRFLEARSRLMGSGVLAGSALVRDPALRPLLYHAVPELLARLPRRGARAALAAAGRAMSRPGVPPAFRDRVLRRAAVAAGLAKPSLLLYDHALHFIGGGQKYAAWMAWALGDAVRVSCLCHFPPPPGIWRLHGGPYRFPVAVLPLTRRLGRTQVTPGLSLRLRANPFRPVSRASADAALLINANMAFGVRPRSDIAVFPCHFPLLPRRRHFHVPGYDVLLCSSRYGAAWTRRRWRLRPQAVIHPPIAPAATRRPKERIILSVARLEKYGSKMQGAMIEAFARLCRREPEARRWRLLLAGGAVGGERAEADLWAHAMHHPGLRIGILPNPSSGRLGTLYARAAVFWHLCGLGRSDPAWREHFGMSVVEAMRNGCVPVVFDGGGLRESVRHGTDGFRVRTLEACVRATRRLVLEPALRRRMSAAARRRGGAFGPARFRREVRALLLPRIRAYARPGPPPAGGAAGQALHAACLRAWERSRGP